MFEQSQQLILNIFDFFNMLKTMLKRMYLGKGCSQCQKIVFKDNMLEQIVEIHRQVASDAQKRNMNAINIPKKYLIIVGQHSIRLLKYKESFAQNMNDQLTECKRFQPPVYGCQINERNAAAKKSNHDLVNSKLVSQTTISDKKIRLSYRSKYTKQYQYFQVNNIVNLTSQINQIFPMPIYWRFFYQHSYKIFTKQLMIFQQRVQNSTLFVKQHISSTHYEYHLTHQMLFLQDKL